LQYQGEHLPHHDSRLELSNDVDALGVPRLRTHLTFHDSDIREVIEAHRRIDSYLRQHGVGYLEYDTDDLETRVREQLHGGYHQTGTTRMSDRPQDGVVDANLRVHGIGNLYVASSSTFPTSSHANSTFMIVVFALRLADHIHKEIAPRTQPVGEVARGC
jgi:choline dehydrogenase-like flavoprotein